MKLILQRLTGVVAIVTALSIGSKASAQSSLSPELSSVPKTVIGGQIEAFKARQHDRAFEYAAPGIKKNFGTTDRFIKMVKNGFAPIYSAQSWSYGRSQVEGDILLQEVNLIGPSGKDWVALYTLRRQSDGSWRIAAVQIKEGKAQST